MGTSGAALFADDTACDVHDEFVELLASGVDAAKATETLINSWGDAVTDVDDGPVFWLALAATQWKYGCLDAAVRACAIDVIDRGTDLARWQGSAELKRRRSVLLALREQLLSPQPRQRRPRRRKPVHVPSVRVPSPDGRAVAVASALGHSPWAGAPRMQVIVDFNLPDGPGGGGVFTADCEWDQVRLSWLDAGTLQIEHPASATISTRKDQTWYRGESVKIKYLPLQSDRSLA